MSYKPLDFDWLENIIVPAIDMFYETQTDRDLINKNISERTLIANIYYKMILFFQNSKKSNKALQHLSIDVEYNRNTFDSKKAYMKCYSCTQDNCFVKKNNYCISKIVPDMIMHQRGSNDDNQVAIEFKKKCNKDKNQRNNDIAKLTYLTCQQPFDKNEKHNFKYRYGYFIDMDNYSYSITSYENTEKKTMKTSKEGNWV